MKTFESRSATCDSRACRCFVCRTKMAISTSRQCRAGAASACSIFETLCTSGFSRRGKSPHERRRLRGLTARRVSRCCANGSAVDFIFDTLADLAAAACAINTALPPLVRSHRHENCEPDLPAAAASGADVPLTTVGAVGPRVSLSSRDSLQ